MSVKGIFKVLIGTVLVMVFGTLIAEYINMYNASSTIARIQKMAASNAAELFAQETYKSSNGIVENVYNCDGGVYITSDFYIGSNKEDIWNSIYVNDNFKTFCDNVRVQKGGTWDTLDILDKAIQYKKNGWYTPFTDGTGISNYRRNSSVSRYANGLYTPINAGIPYLDRDVTQRIFRWNLAQLLSNCTSSNIRKDTNGVYYVNYNGFACYAQYATITNISYNVYNLNTEDGKNSFKRLTGLEADRLAYNTPVSTLGIDASERKWVIVASVEYSMPVTYFGVTPLSSIITYGNRRVAGVDGNTPESGNETFKPNISNLTGGGDSNFSKLSGVNAQSLTSGNLVFYIVK